jgi:acyl carrier protein phosphodiesterase
VADIYYDHFLAAHWQQYSNRELSVFVQEIYILLIKNYLTLPPHTQRIVPIMILRNWLGTYQSIPHLHQVFLQMHHRTGELGNMNKATEILQQNYSALEADFMGFFRDVQLFSQRKLIELSASPNKIDTPKNSRNTE